MKAYDCVEHSFIWCTMEVLGYHPHLIILAKGLVEKVGSKVHVNELFTEPIKLKHGVWEGYHVSSLLFTISMQPFMLMIQEKVDNRELEGVHITSWQQLTHQLFANDI